MPFLRCGHCRNLHGRDGKRKILSRISKLCEENGVQVVTVVTDLYTGDSIEKYANTVFNEFQIGSKQDNNGVLLIVALDDGEVRIEVGDGLIGLLPDSKTGKLLDDYFMPYAENDDMEQAVYETFKQVVKIVSKSNTAGYDSSTNKGTSNSANKSTNKSTATAGISRKDNSKDLNIRFVFIVIFIFVVIVSKKVRKKQHTYNGHDGDSPSEPIIPPRENNSNNSIKYSSYTINQDSSSGKGSSFSGSGEQSSGSRASWIFDSSSNSPEITLSSPQKATSSSSKKNTSNSPARSTSSSPKKSTSSSSYSLFGGSGGKSSGSGASRSFGKK